jgi:hypothetical protein
VKNKCFKKLLKEKEKKKKKKEKRRKRTSLKCTLLFCPHHPFFVWLFCLLESH